MHRDKRTAENLYGWAIPVIISLFGAVAVISFFYLLDFLVKKIENFFTALSF
jgi:hypothetical protein